jgi:hypothetical protein
MNRSSPRRIEELKILVKLCGINGNIVVSWSKNAIVKDVVFSVDHSFVWLIQPIREVALLTAFSRRACATLSQEHELRFCKVRSPCVEVGSGTLLLWRRHDEGTAVSP